MLQAGIIGIMHARPLRKELKALIAEAIKKSRVLALEISAAELKKYKKIWERPDFEREFAKLSKRPGALKERFDVDESFFTIATLAKKYGVRIVPIDSEGLIKRASKLERKLFELGSKLDEMGVIRFDVRYMFCEVPQEKIRELQKTNPQAVKLVTEYYKTYYEMKWIEEIEREKIMEMHIKAKRPDLVIVGVGHYDGIKEACNCRHIYKDPFIPSDFRKTYNRIIARNRRIKEMMARFERPALPKPKKRVQRRAK